MNITHEYLTQRLGFVEERLEEAKAGANFWAGQRKLLLELLAEEKRIDAANGADTSPDGTPPTT